MLLSSGTVSLSTYPGRPYSVLTLNALVPTDGEIGLVLEIIDQIGQPALQMVESLIANNAKWDNVSRNDFCRYG